MRLIFSSLIFLITISVHAQEPSELESKRLKWKDGYMLQAKEACKSFETQDGTSGFSDSVQRQYYVDTFVVNRVYEEMLVFDGTTLGINQANMYCTGDYEKLILKYQTILESKLLPEDKKLFHEANNAWLNFYEGQKKLVGALMQPDYNGGGTIQTIIYTGRLKQLQQDRLQQLIDLLKDFI